MAVVVVPVGLDMGPVFEEAGRPDRLPMRYEVHLGGEPQELTAQQYTAWLAAFGSPERHADPGVDRASLEGDLRNGPAGPAGPVADPAPVVQDLLDRSMLLEYDPDAMDEKVFGAFRLYPRAHGLGSTPERPEHYGIGYPGDTFAEVGPTVYQLLSLSLTFPALWYAFEDMAEAERGDPPPGGPRSAAEIGRVLGVVLPSLVCSGAAFLDALNYEPPELDPVTPDGRTTPDRSESSVIVPVGLNMGEDCTARDPDDDPDAARWLVHHGTNWAELDPEESAAYLAAFNERERQERGELNRHSLARLLRASDRSAEPEPAIDRLLDRGLLVEYDPETGPFEQLFRGLQLFPLGHGLGNTAEHPGRYRIGIAGAPELWVGPEVYAIWSYSLTGRSLWDACADLAEGADEDLQEGEEPLGYRPDDLAAAVAEVLPGMIAHGCAFLDPLNYVQ
ncbi:MAG: hypothetical protein ACRDMV_03745 [Streptosporangiales bacterium]